MRRTKLFQEEARRLQQFLKEIREAEPKIPAARIIRAKAEAELAVIDSEIEFFGRPSTKLYDGRWLMCVYSPGWFVMRIGLLNWRGFSIGPARPPLFSERNGTRRVYRTKKWEIEFFGPRCSNRLSSANPKQRAKFSTLS